MFCLLPVMFYLLYEEKSHYHFRVRSIKFHSLIWHFYLSDIFLLWKKVAHLMSFSRSHLSYPKRENVERDFFSTFFFSLRSQIYFTLSLLVTATTSFRLFSLFFFPSLHPLLPALYMFLYQAFNSYEQNRYCPFGGKYRRGGWGRKFADSSKQFGAF